MREVEAKFLVQHPGQFDQVLGTLSRHGYTVSGGKAETLVDRYFDTPDWACLRSGWTFRCRERAGQSVLTLKSAGSKSGAVFTRDEVEQPLPGATVCDPGAVPEGPVRRWLRALVNGQSCRELFRIRNHRKVYGLETPAPESARIELDLDRSTISVRHAGKSAPGHLEFTELELELASGAPDAVDRLALVLREEVGLLPAQLSKFQRGIQAAGLVPDTAGAMPSPARLGPGDPLLDLVYAQLGEKAAELRLHEARAWEGLHPEGVHDMRVTIRRLRTLLRTFSAMLPAAGSEHLNGELRWLARQLGKARDADVCTAAIGRYLGSLPEHAEHALAPYERYLRDTTSQAYAELVEVLESDRYTGLLRALDRLVGQGPDDAILRGFGALRIDEAGKRYVRPLARQIATTGRRIKAGLPSRDLHKLRIKMKRLRYLLECLSAAEPERWRKPLKAAGKLQSFLGEHQDAETAARRIEEYAQTIEPRKKTRDTILVLGRIVEHEDRRRRKCRKRFPKKWQACRADLPV